MSNYNDFVRIGDHWIRDDSIEHFYLKEIQRYKTVHPYWNFFLKTKIQISSVWRVYAVSENYTTYVECKSRKQAEKFIQELLSEVE